VNGSARESVALSLLYPKASIVGGIVNDTIRILAIATAALLLQACAPDQSGNAAADNWWRVTPVDIAGAANGASSSAPTVGTNQASEGLQNQNQYQEAINSTTVSVYRFFNVRNGAHLTSLSPMNSYPWASEGEIFPIFVTDNRYRVAVYACVAGADYFTSNDENCGGSQVLGRIGYLDRRPSGFAPNAVYHCAAAARRGFSGGHMDTTNSAECSSHGFTVESILGYAR
jgi:hypothetical protein